MRKLAPIALALVLLAPLASVAAEPASETLDWENWHADNEVSNVASLQRGARNFMNYCAGCHSMKFVRYSRLAEDLKIPTDRLKANLLPPGAAPADYIQSSMPGADAVVWFGKVPPDLSLMARSRGVDHLYKFLKTFYVDPALPNRTNNLVLNTPAMPAVLSELEGVKVAVFKNVEVTADGKTTVEKHFDHFDTIAPGQLTAPEYDAFVRDTVNFLDYAGEPAQVDRRSIGVWVVLFLLVFTWFAYLLKKEYWKDVL